MPALTPELATGLAPKLTPRLTPGLTYVIPVYNGAEFIARAIGSIVSQSGEDARIIVVDDGSTDDSFEIAQRQSGRLIVLKQDNVGVCAARNRALAQVETELVCFIDADDYVIGPHRRWMEAAWREGVDMIIGLPAMGCADQVVLEARNKYRDTPEPLSILRRYLDDDCVLASTIVWSTAFLRRIGGWDGDLTVIEDIELAMRALLHHPRIVLSEAPAWAVWHDHDHPGRLSRLMDARAAASHVTAMNKLLDLIDRCGGDGKTLRLGLRRCMKEGRRLYLNGRPREAMALFALARSRGYAIHHGPAFERLLARLLGTRRVLALRTAYTAIKRGGRHQ